MLRRGWKEAYRVLVSLASALCFSMDNRQGIRLIAGERAQCVCSQAPSKMKCIFSMWNFILITRLEEESRKKASQTHPNSPPLLFLFVTEAKWGQLLEISVQPWMPQWWLSLRLMHLIYLFSISEMLFRSQLGVPGPRSCSMMRCTPAVSTQACLQGFCAKEEVGWAFCVQTPAPSSIGGRKLK